MKPYPRLNPFPSEPIVRIIELHALGNLLQNNLLGRNQRRQRAITLVERVTGVRLTWGHSRPDDMFSRLVPLGNRARYFRYQRTERITETRRMYSDENILQIDIEQNFPSPSTGPDEWSLFRFSWRNDAPRLPSATEMFKLTRDLGVILGAYLGHCWTEWDFHPDRDRHLLPTNYDSYLAHFSSIPSRDYGRMWHHEPENKGGPGPAMPKEIHWINYWGPKTCELVGGFPPPPEFRDAYAAAEPLPGGGWVWQVTEETFNYRRPEHRRALARAYAAFLEVGNRNPRSRWPRASRRIWADPLWTHPPYLLEFHFACPPRLPGDRRALVLAETIENFYREAEAAGEDFGGWRYIFRCAVDRIAPQDNCQRLIDRDAYLLDTSYGDIGTIMADNTSSNMIQGRHCPRPEPGYLFVRVFIDFKYPQMPTLGERKADVFLETFARVLGAFWGRVLLTPHRFVTDAQIDTGDPRDPHPDFLPLVRPPEEMPDVYTPPALGWINYWSKEACERVGFPPTDPDPELMSLARPTADGAWLVRVHPQGDTPLTDIFDQFYPAIARFHARFPRIGARDTFAQDTK